MNRGKWHLVYTHVNEMEAGTFRDGIEDVEIPLEAISEDAAVLEARSKWADVQKQYAEHPPILTTDSRPRVIYKVPL